MEFSGQSVRFFLSVSFVVAQLSSLITHSRLWHQQILQNTKVMKHLFGHNLLILWFIIVCRQDNNVDSTSSVKEPVETEDKQGNVKTHTDHTTPGIGFLYSFSVLNTCWTRGASSCLGGLGSGSAFLLIGKWCQALTFQEQSWALLCYIVFGLEWILWFLVHAKVTSSFLCNEYPL